MLLRAIAVDAGRRFALVCALAIAMASIAVDAWSGQRMDFHELMKVRKITASTISDNGEWVAYAFSPDRGDGGGMVADAGGHRSRTVDGASSVEVAADGAFASFVVGPSFEERETLEEDELPKDRVVLLRTSDGQRVEFDAIKSSAFSDDGQWWVRLLAAPEVAADDSTSESEERSVGTRLVLRRLADGEEWGSEAVVRYAFDPTSRYLAFTVATEDGEGNSLRWWSLGEEPVETLLHERPLAAYPALAWARDLPRLAFVVGDEAEPGQILDLRLHAFVEGDRELASRDSLPAGMELAEENELTWSLDGQRLFFGMLPTEGPAEEEANAAADSASSFDPYDFDRILDDRGVDVWHWRDPRIKSHEKESWEERSETQRLAVVHLDDGEVVPLADDLIPEVRPELEASRVLASTAVPYLRQQTWGWFYRDYYLIDLRSGERERLVEKSSDTVTISEDGAHVAFYREGHWYLLALQDGTVLDLSRDLDVPFANEDHDYPFPTPGYGSAGWIRGGGGVLVNDKYDIWRMPLDGGAPLNLTRGRGRAERLQFRITDTDPDLEGFEDGSTLLLSAMDDDTKEWFVYEVRTDGSGWRKLYGPGGRLRYQAKARDAERLLLTIEDYGRFPDLWTANPHLEKRHRVSDVNPQLQDFDLGTSELVEWESLDGVPTQGVLIKPPDYDSNRRYPLLVYYYRFSSQRVHQFNDPVINHRPSFYVYAGDDYCVFLPDIRFEIGRPGLAATKSLVPGVQMLVDRGIVDRDAVALHGHSWSGYQTAQMVTQTDYFACAVAGAPVSNMTSAYGGIRWESGRSRQFQYEMGQSRIGATLWNGLDRYIDNSPVFFADRIHTPLLIEFGDEDGAVPWTQGIELYMAMRRLDQPCVMLQYRGEPHHLKKYANKLDYSLKMKAFIDHFCKGAEAPEWWVEGVSYSGE